MANALLLGLGFAPFIAHYGAGAWQALRMGPWPDFVPLGPIGGVVMMAVTADPALPRAAMGLIACAFVAVFATLASRQRFTAAAQAKLSWRSSIA